MNLDDDPIPVLELSGKGLVADLADVVLGRNEIDPDRILRQGAPA